MRYISLVLASAEEGIAKPEPEIFLRALSRAECKPEEAVMIGDRLDNDIFPANCLGMKTIQVSHGMAAYQHPEDKEHTPDFTVSSLEELLKIL